MAKHDLDHCPICGTSTDVPTAVFHWRSATSATIVAVTCSDECAAEYETVMRRIKL